MILTDRRLYYQMLMPKSEIEIDIRKIIRVEEVKRHLGKSKGRLLIKVEFKNQLDQIDSCAWLVKNHKLWIKNLYDTIN